MTVTENTHHHNIRTAVMQQFQGAPEIKSGNASRIVKIEHPPVPTTRPEAAHFATNRSYTLTPSSSSSSGAIHNVNFAITKDYQATSSSIVTPQPISDAQSSTQKHQQHVDDLEPQTTAAGDEDIEETAQKNKQLMQDLKQEIAKRDKEIAHLKRMQHSLAEIERQFTDQEKDIAAAEQQQELIKVLRQQIADRDKEIASCKRNQHLVDQLKLQIAHQNEEITFLKQELAKQPDLRQAQAELEDLTRSLFEEANGMVARGRQELSVAIGTIQSLKQELTQTKALLRQEQSQLAELRQRIHDEEKRNSASHWPDAPATPANWVMRSSCLSNFRQFVEKARSTPLHSMHRLPFMEQCIKQEIEPCLQFSKKSKFFVRRLMDAMLHQSCFIEKASCPFAICSLCGFQDSDVFLFKKREEDENWYTVDRCCRDRLVAACNFYVFVRYIHMGLLSQGRSIESLFHESVRLRLCMFWARTGLMSSKQIGKQTRWLSDTQVPDMLVLSHMLSLKRED